MSESGESIQVVLQRLESSKRSGNGWIARCPAHDDRDPSLSIRTGNDDRVLLHCHAGCQTEDICAALGLTLSDLFVQEGEDHRPASRNGRPVKSTGFPSREAVVTAAGRTAARRLGGSANLVANYPYHNSLGQDHMVVLRFEPTGGGRKTFVPIHSCEGTWRMGDTSGPLPLYRQPDLVGKDPVLVCEGEKAVDVARKLGFLATTSAHGANSAGRTDWSPLAGRRVIVLPDNDKAGTGYAHGVVQILSNLVPAPEVGIVKLPDIPEGGDIADFVDVRRSKQVPDHEIREEIHSLLKAAQDPNHTSRPDPEPLETDLPPVPRFDLDLLPDALRPWVEDISARTQCPPDFTAVAAMVAVAGVIGRRVGIRPKRHDDWLVVSNIWGAAVGRPGIMKTPAIQEAFRGPNRLEARAKANFDAAMDDYRAACVVEEQRRKVIEGEIKKALKAGDNSRAHELAEEILRSKQAVPIRKRYIVNDTTVEKLGEILRDNPRGLTVYRDELTGLLQSLDKEGSEGARAFYLEAWNGTGSYTYDRIGRGTIEVEAAIVSIIGGIQPGPLQRYLRAALQSGRGDDGLMQRFQLVVWPDVSSTWMNIDRPPDHLASDRVFRAFRRLDTLEARSIGATTEEDDPNGVPWFRFDDDAQPIFDTWRCQLEETLRAGEEHPAIESHLAKYRSLIPSLALICHLVDDGEGPVPRAVLERAIGWGEYLRGHLPRIYSCATRPDLAAAKALSKKILSGALKDGFALRDVYRPAWAGLGTREEAQLAITVLEDYGWIWEVSKPTPGRTRKCYRIHPRIPEIQKDRTDRTDKSPSVSSVSRQEGGSPGFRRDNETPDGIDEERAAILEYEGGHSRDEAERLAFPAGAPDPDACPTHPSRIESGSMRGL